MSTITSPVMLDKTGRELVSVGRSIAAALWAEKAAKVESKDANFYDYDGEIVYSYTKAEFLTMTELPANPAHDGLTSQGWNWSLEAAKAYVQKYGAIDIGQNYITDDGKTRLYVRIGYPENLTINLRFHQSVDAGVTIDWGDGSAEETAVETPPASGTLTGKIKMTHTYPAEGNYVVKMTVADGCEVRLGHNTGTGTTLVAIGGTNSFFSQGNRGMISGRDALMGIEIGEGVTDIGSGAFAYTTSLELIIIPQTVQTIRDIAFFACFALKAFIIPDGVTSVGKLFAAYCHVMKAFCMPATVTAIGERAFKSDIALLRITIPEGVATISNGVFHECHELRTVVVPDTVTGTIGSDAFHNCHKLVSINIPEGVTVIGTTAFTQCHSLRDIELPEGLLEIKERAFSGCFGFKGLVIPSTVESIEGLAFLYDDGCNEFHVKATTPPILQATAFTQIGAPLSIYVPYSTDHSILNAYLAATGWASKAEYIQEEAES